MVLLMESDGSLTPSVPQARFARTYNDGIGQGSASEPMQIFEDDADADVIPGRLSGRVHRAGGRAAVRTACRDR